MAKRYKVKRGEDLVSIAARFGTTPQTLMNLNKVRTVSTGVGLKIPQGRLNAPMYTPSQQRALGVGAPSGNVRGKDFFSTINPPAKQPSFLESLRNALLGGTGFDTGGASGGSAIRGYAPKVQASPTQQQIGFGGGNGIQGKSGSSLSRQTGFFGINIPNITNKGNPLPRVGSFGQQNLWPTGMAEQGNNYFVEGPKTQSGTVSSLAQNMTPGFVYDPNSGSYVAPVTPSGTSQGMFGSQATGFTNAEGDAYIQGGLQGDKWEVVYRDGVKVTQRAGRRRGKGGRARRQAWNAQAQQAEQAVAPNEGAISTGLVWRIM